MNAVSPRDTHKARRTGIGRAVRALAARQTRLARDCDAILAEPSDTLACRRRIRAAIADLLLLQEDMDRQLSELAVILRVLHRHGAASGAYLSSMSSARR